MVGSITFLKKVGDHVKKGEEVEILTLVIYYFLFYSGWVILLLLLLLFERERGYTLSWLIRFTLCSLDISHLVEVP